MAVTLPLFGAFLGAGVGVYVNAVRKLPLFRNPYQHALWVGAGYAFGSWLEDFETRTRQDLEGECGGLPPPTARRCLFDAVLTVVVTFATVAAMLKKREEANKHLQP